MAVKLELYRVFQEVARMGNISAAAQNLYISQSAVSQSIKTLERKLGQPLFIRSTKKVQLTPAGQLLLKHVEPAMNLIRRGENQLFDSQGLGLGQLHIGASDTICRYYLVPFLSHFHSLYPNIHIKVTNRTSIECARLLENGQVDFIITNYPNSALSNTQNIEMLRPFHDVFAANEAFFPLKGRKMSLEELQTYPILMLDKKSTTSEFLHSMFQKHQLDLVPEIELSSNDLLLDLARIGLGIACVPDYMLKENDQLTPLMLKEPLPGRQLILAQHDSLTVSQAAERFIEMFTSI